MVRIKYTLAFLKQNNAVLLGYKTRGLGAHLWNGFGGKLEAQETVEAAALRELREESNLCAGNLNLIAVIHYIIEGSEREDVVYLFTSSTFQGEIIESEEMCPIRWFERVNVPYDNMWSDCKLWFEDMFADKYFSMIVKFNKDMSEIVIHEKIYYNDRREFLKGIAVYE